MNSSARITFIAIVSILCLALFGIGIWTVKKQRTRDQNDLQELHNKFSLLENQVNVELGNVRDSAFIYTDPTGSQDELSQSLIQIQGAKKDITDKPANVLKKYNDYDAIYSAAFKALEKSMADRDKNTRNFMENSKQQIDKYKGELDKALKQNRYLSAKLAQTIKEFTGTKAELVKMQEEKARVDALLKDQTITRAELDSIISDRNELRELLAKSQRTIAEQRSQIEKLLEPEKTVKSFKASYMYSNREVILDTQNRHRNSQVEEITLNFVVGDLVFEQGDAKVVYVTLFGNDGKPVARFNKQPITVVGNTGKYSQKIDPKLPKGNYFFRMTYKEKSIMPDYKFILDSTLF